MMGNTEKMRRQEYAPEIKAVLDYALVDDESPCGGIDHPGETVAEYLESVAGDGVKIRTLAELNEALIASGIKPVEAERPSIRAQLAAAESKQREKPAARARDREAR